MTVTIKQVAKHAGVSVPTVSRILNHKGQSYNSQTRERVFEAAQSLGYQPNHISRTLAGCRSMTIGMITSMAADPARVLQFRGFERFARDNGYSVYLLSHSIPVVGDPPGPELQPILNDIQSLMNRRVDGLVIGLPEYLVQTEPVRNALQNVPVPVVCLGVGLHRVGLPYYVSGELSPAYRQLAAHLRELGHREAAYVRSSGDTCNPNLRTNLLSQSLKDEGLSLTLDDAWVIDSNANAGEHGYEIAQHMIEQNKLATAVVACADEVAMGLMLALHRAAVRMPEDVSVVGFGDQPMAAFCYPPLTTIRLPREEAGRAAFAMLEQLMREPDEQSDPVEPVLTDIDLTIRESTGPSPK